jgi:hypothetical protein
VRLRILIPSTCVGLRYGHQNNSLAAFLGSITSAGSSGKNRISPTTLGLMDSGFSWNPPLSSAVLDQRYGLLSLLRPHIVQTPFRWCRNVDLLSIVYTFRPQLRIRLTLSGLTFLRKPWIFGVPGSHRNYHYSCRQSLFLTDTKPHGLTLHQECSPTPYTRRYMVTASVSYLSPVTSSAQRRSTSELLRFL